MEKTSKLTDRWWKKVKRKVNSVWKWIKLPFRIGYWLRRHWKTAVLVGIFAVGLAMMFGGAFRLRGAELVTVLVVAGILMAFAYAKMAFDLAVKRRIKEKESQDLSRKQDELAKELDGLRKELERERNKKVKVLNIQPILEMGILEAECEVTKFFDRYFDKDDQEIIEDTETAPEGKDSTARKKVKRFLGALTSKFKARYGIDIQKVQVKRDDQTKTIFVAGADPSFLGTRGFPQMRWESYVGLRLNWWDGWVTDLVDSPKLESKCTKKYQESLQKSLENGPEQLEWVKEPLRKTIKRLLEMIIAPSDYRVELVDHPGEGYVPLFDYMRLLGLEGPDQLFLP